MLEGGRFHLLWRIVVLGDSSLPEWSAIKLTDGRNFISSVVDLNMLNIKHGSETVAFPPRGTHSLLGDPELSRTPNDEATSRAYLFVYTSRVQSAAACGVNSPSLE